MLKKHTSYYLMSFFLEAALGVGALWAAELLTQYLVFPGASPAAPSWMFLVAAVGLPLLLYCNHAHSFPSRAPLRELAWPTAKAVLQLVTIIIAVSFATKNRDTSRLAVILFGAVSYGLALFKQTCFERLLARSRPHWEILLIGNSSTALTFLDDTLRGKWPCGINLFGLLTDDPELKEGDTLHGIPVLGRVDCWENILRQNQIIDEVVIFPNGKMGVSLNRIIRLGQELQVRVRMSVGEADVDALPTVERVGRSSLISFEPNPDSFVAMLVKRGLDRVGALLLLILLSPVFLAIALLIKLTSPGPVVFCQKRTGQRGRPFRMYKFRTMRNGAEGQKALLMAANEMTGPVFKIKQDPRITRIGRFLRRFSLDELPQIINVLKGDMSLVGPRPLPITEAEKCDRWEKRRFSLKPGITCLWQVSGRSLLDFSEWMKLDLAYVNNWSLSLDFKILARTFGAVITGRGAY